MAINHDQLQRQFREADSHFDLVNAFCESGNGIKNDLVQTIVMAINIAYDLGKRDAKKENS